MLSYRLMICPHNVEFEGEEFINKYQYMFSLCNFSKTTTIVGFLNATMIQLHIFYNS